MAGDSLDHEEAGSPMKMRAILALFVVVASAGAAIGLERLGSKAPGDLPPSERSATGGWFCPHGGGKDWNVTLQVANPGDEAVRVRTTTFAEDGVSEVPNLVSVEPGANREISVPSTDKAASSFIEYFGGWVGAAWVTETDSGVAAEPCLADVADALFLPDGTTERGENAFVVVVNPFDIDAVFNLTILREGDEPVTLDDWTGFVLKPRHSVLFHLNEAALGAPTAAAKLDVSLGRVAAASIGTASGGGIRSAIGILGPPPARSIMSGGSDTGETQVIIANSTRNRGRFEVRIVGSEKGRVLPEQARKLDARSAHSFPFVTEGPSGIDVRGQAGFGVAAARRSFSGQGDRGATSGVAAPASDWLVLPAGLKGPLEPRLVISNPGEEEAEVTVTLLGESGPLQDPGPETFRVGPGRTAVLPSKITEKAPRAAALVEASSGEVVASFATYSANRNGYAVSAGLPIPA
ncbi:MAG: DUF5719 family protein [Actinomycetota bacterium]